MRTRFTTSARRRISIAAGCVVLAFGAIVLARARTHAEESPHAAAGGSRAAIDTPEMTGFVALTQGAVLANGTRELFAEMRVEARHVEGEARRRPIALAIALDVSGSMAGDKIDEARRAVQALVGRMRPEDRIAIVTYSDHASVLQALAPMSAAREGGMSTSIESLAAGGGTNIPSGLTLAAELLSGAPPEMVRRLVLVSDGLDGSGVALTDIQAQVQARAGAGMTTSALGIGVDYDERWLGTVADAGRGNYQFLAQGHELTAFLARELDQAGSTVADRTQLALALPAGYRLTEVWGSARDGNTIPLGALFAGERRRVTMRFEVDAGAAGTATELGLALSYRTVANSRDRNLELARLSVRVVPDEAQVLASRDVTLHAEAVAQQVDARQAQAIDAWRGGRIEEARSLTQANLSALRTWRADAPAASAQLDARIEELDNDMDNFEGLGAGSAEGRAYGLGANARRRARAEAF